MWPQSKATFVCKTKSGSFWFIFFFLSHSKAAADLKAFSMGTGDPPFTDRWVLQQSWNRTSTEKCFFYYLFCFLIVLVFNMWSILTHSESSCFVLPCLFGRLKRRDTLLHQTPRFIVHTEETWLPQLRGRGKKKKIICFHRCSNTDAQDNRLRPSQS